MTDEVETLAALDAPPPVDLAGQPAGAAPSAVLGGGQGHRPVLGHVAEAPAMS